VIFTETRIPGAYVIEADVFEDDRGSFTRVFCERELEMHGLKLSVTQSAVSYNKRKGTLRGMHYQVAPHAQAKLVRCTRGAIYDVLVDLRPESANMKQWVGMELSASNRRLLLIPEGFAHGFLTLEDESEVTYLLSDFYAPDCERGLRWDDPAIAVEWPFSPEILSQRDAAYPAWRLQ
jgi:dTDP-4-dehydrorhamnose 3,5-epimerase